MALITASGDKFPGMLNTGQLCQFARLVIPMWINGCCVGVNIGEFEAIPMAASEKQVEIAMSFVDNLCMNLRTDFSTGSNNFFNPLYILSYYRETE